MIEELTNYKRISHAIRYIQQNYSLQPSLDEIASEVNLSPFHFQRLFTDWAGVSPKQFLQFISASHAKQLLSKKDTLSNAAFETGFSGTSRLHDLFIKLEGMSPAEYKNGGKNLLINYSYYETHFGRMLVASTHKGICYMGFVYDLSELSNRFPEATLKEKKDSIQTDAVSFYTQDWKDLKQIKLHLKGTDFQLKVWETLLKIPLGKLTTYGSIASQIDKPKASRAVGTAIGCNPVGFLIPCHRVIRSNGETGGYMWGDERKSAMIGWEAAQVAKHK